MKTNLGSKGSDRVISDDKSTLEGSKVMSNNSTVDQYIKTTLQSRKKGKRDLTGGKTLLSRVAKQYGLPALGRVSDKTYRVGLEKYVFPVVLVSRNSPYTSCSQNDLAGREVFSLQGAF